MKINYLPKRKSIRLRKYNYSLPNYYFVTICANNRQCLFGKINNGKIKLNAIGETTNKYWRQLVKQFNHISLGKYIIMPNHLHGIIIIKNVGAGYPRPQIPLGQIIAWFKYQSTKQINQIINDPAGIINNGREDRAPTNKKYPKIWQRNYYEHIIRNEEELGRIEQYIITNPTMWSYDTNRP